MGQEIIETQEREVEARCLSDIASEIKVLTEHLQRTLITGIIEIGKRFDAAKALVEHGKWGEFCEEITGYSQSMAENYIKVYKEYGSEQYNLFADFSNSQSIAKLGVTKLIALTAIPAEDREEFVEKNNITEETTVKELQDKIKELNSQIENKDKSYTQKIEELEKEIDESMSDYIKRCQEVEELKERIEFMESSCVDDNSDEMQSMIMAAEEKARDAMLKELNAAEDKRKKADEKYKKLKDKYEELQNSRKNDELLFIAEKEKTEAEKVKNEELKKEIERLKKESSLSSREDIAKLNLCFEDAQESIKRVKLILEKMDEADRSKFSDGVAKVLKSLVEEI